MSDTANQNALSQGRTFVWHEVYGPKTEDLIQFYTEALDFGTSVMPMGEMGDYHMLTRDGQGVCGVMGTQGTHMEGTPPHWSTYIAVDDVDARLTKCVELGAKVLVEAMDVPTVGRMALIQDPFGASFWLFRGSSAE